MSALSLVCIAAVAAWVVLVVVAQLLNPDQSALSMGMSGLARGRAPWVMKAAFAVRGIAALALVAALPGALPMHPLVVVGLILFWAWGAGSALLALADTDMPGEQPTRAGAVHVYIALIAYLAGVAGAILLSLGLRGDEATAGVARWALLIALAATVALFVQFAGFAAAAREAADVSASAAPAAGSGGLGRYAGLLQRVFLALLMLWTVVVAVGI